MAAPTRTAETAPERLVVVRARNYGRWVVGVVAAALFAVVVVAFARADIDYPVVAKYFASPAIVGGMLRTLQLTVLAMVVGLVLGVLAAVMRQSGNGVLVVIASGYTWLFRGIPVLVQLLIWFNISIVVKTIDIPGIYTGPTTTLMTPFMAALIGLGVNEGAYIAEIVRGGIQAVGRGQSEAAAALGMRRGTTMRRIVLPQAMRVIVPPLGNEFIALLKYSSLAYAISYSELLNSANKIYTSNFKVIELLFTASLWYLILTTVFTLLQHLMERRLARSQTGALGPRLLRNLSFGRR